MSMLAFSNIRDYFCKHCKKIGKFMLFLEDNLLDDEKDDQLRTTG